MRDLVSEEACTRRFLHKNSYSGEHTGTELCSAYIIPRPVPMTGWEDKAYIRRVAEHQPVT